MMYHWLNVPTGEKGESVFEGQDTRLTRQAQLELVNEWNSRDPEHWVYWID